MGKQLWIRFKYRFKKFLPEISHDYAVELSMSSISNVIEEIMDLDFKILKNTTKQPL
jgi:hypothetical protein